MSRPGGELEAGPSVVNVLMFHSIADGTGPTSIAPGVFAEQMATLARSGVAVVPLDSVIRWMDTGVALPSRVAAITFDDGFADFLPAANVLFRHGFPVTMFLPTGCMGSVERWAGAPDPPRPIMSWDDARVLATQGVSFGGHTVTHPDLTTMNADAMSREIRVCREDIEHHLGVTPTTFAAPFGAANAAVRGEIARWFDGAVSTRLAQPRVGADVHDIPRIEMWYFRDPRRWESFLDGGAKAYFGIRQLGRRLKGIASDAGGR